MSTTEGIQSIDLVQVGEASTAQSWLVSDWAAGQTTIMEWSTNNVVAQSDGSVQFSLSAASEGSAYAYCGGAVKSCEAASVGTWTWTAQAPVMQDGAVFGMFTYRADHFIDPWLEFDFEFVGTDTTKVRLNIHMETSAGEHVTLEQANSWQPVIVDLGFDAAQGMHTYDITVTDTEAIFLVDGQVVGRFGAADMPFGTWTTGDMKGVTNLWCVDPRLEFWAGDWAYSGEPLTATIGYIDVRPGDLGAFDPAASLAINGDDAANELHGSDGNDILNGYGAADVLIGGSGSDKLYGGTGSDVLTLDVGDDLLEGGSGHDWVQVSGTLGATVDLAVTKAQNTGYGIDTIQSIQNASGGIGTDRLSGNAGSNTLQGGSGNDTLLGRGGKDILEGGSDNDDLAGGDGADQLRGDDGSDTLRLDASDDTLDGGLGVDWVRATGPTAVTIDLAKTAAQSTGFGSDTVVNVENAGGGTSADRLSGNAAVNTLAGYGGADVLSGGMGQDTLYGGSDKVRDIFVFSSVNESVVGTQRDMIFDLMSGIDDLDLSRIDPQAAISGNQAFQFSGTTANANSVWYAASGSDVIVRADTNGDRTTDFEVRILGVTFLIGDDFML